MLREPQGTPPHLALTGDAVKRLAAVLRHAARIRKLIEPVTVEEVVISYGGTEWRVEIDDETGIEWWTDLLTGNSRQGPEVTRGEAPAPSGLNEEGDPHR